MCEIKGPYSSVKGLNQPGFKHFYIAQDSTRTPILTNVGNNGIKHQEVMIDAVAELMNNHQEELQALWQKHWLASFVPDKARIENC